MTDETEKTPVSMLISYQVPHVLQLKESLSVSNCVLDASDTGTGKTYTTIALCWSLKLKPFIICPKSVINTWMDVANKMKVEVLGLSNYEKLKGSKYYTSNFEIAECPYIDKTNSKKGKEEFIFQLPHDTIIVVDEAHRCKNHKTVNSKMLMAMRESGRKIILLSATITDKIECFRPFGVVFGFYNDVKKYKFWLRNKLQKISVYEKTEKSEDAIVLKIINESIFPNKGSRMKIKELGDLFPQNQIIAKCYYTDDHEKVNETYDLINKALDDLKIKEKKSTALGQIVRCRMRIEMFKLPIILDQVDDALEAGYSVAIFVNFKDSLNYLVHHIKEDCSTIHGEQSIDERTYNIENFQHNRTKIIISIIQAGGVGISLHDLYGRPRMSLISPSWSGTDVVQALGRIHRAGSKSPALQRIIYIAKSYEEVICQKLGSKLTILSGINDGDLVGPKIDTEKLKDIGDLDTINKNVDLVEEKFEDDVKSDDKLIKKIKKSVKKKNFEIVDDGVAKDIDLKPHIDLNLDDKPPKGKLHSKYVAK